LFIIKNLKSTKRREKEFGKGRIPVVKKSADERGTIGDKWDIERGVRKREAILNRGRKGTESDGDVPT